MNNIQSPRIDDDGVEAMIQAKGKTGPRVTPADIEANIAETHYFGGNFAVLDVAPDHPLSLLTFCVLVLRNGFTVTGISACVDPSNFDVDIGKSIARDNAVQQMWPLMGYHLKESMK